MVSFTKLFTAGLVATSAMAAPMEVPRDSTPPTNKRGVAYNDPAAVHTLASSGGISWAYDWAGSIFGNLPSGIEFVPMLWGTRDFGGWLTTIETALSSGSKYILGFNEPDMPAQANMTPGEAANFYMTHITPFAGKAKLISPAVSSSTNPGMGLSWFESFIGSCSSCGISGLAVHWYGNSADEFKSFVTEAMDTASKNNLDELWITEFGLNADINGITDLGTTTAFINDVVPWLNQQDGVTRYAYFFAADGYLLSGNTLNAAGQTYVSSK
jgi:hypothetical protein